MAEAMIEYLCPGCGRCVRDTILDEIPDPPTCALCNSVGAYRSRLIYDKQHGLITEETFQRLWAEAPI
jgi:hypothetical protein